MTMLSDYRNWLESELKLLGNASHHAYSFGQANMAKRAIERLDAETADKTLVVLPRERVASVLAALQALQNRTDSEEEAPLRELREALQGALPNALHGTTG
jgi:hypothetical protein